MLSLHKIIFLVFTLLFSYKSSFSQYEVAGQIIDSVNKEPLAFVNIIFNNDQTKGSATDIDGKFSYYQPEIIYTLTCGYVGYKKLIINIDSTGPDIKNLLIELSPANLELTEVIITPGENPANRVIKQVIENKKINDPENISSFTYTFYNKLIYDYKSPDSINADSITTKLDSILEKSYLGIMESVTEGKFKQPAKYQETIIGVKVSGFKHPSFAPLATDIQPLSFYNNIIRIFDVYYLNPIADGSLDKYEFQIEDTLYHGEDTTFIISFAPLPHKNFESLTGLLYINTNRYAIQNVIAQPFTEGLIDIKIQQQYDFINNTHWFPVQLNFEMVFLNLPDAETGMFINGKSYMKNINLNANLAFKDFSADAVLMNISASDQDRIFWNFHRVDSLTAIEMNTYTIMDSLGEKYKFDNKLKLLERVVAGKIPVYFVDIDIPKIIGYNKYEGYRFGLGLSTNDNTSKYFSLSGFAGYGLKDHAWKYGGAFTVTPGKYKELYLKAGYENNLQEAGKSGLDFFNSGIYNYKSVIEYEMDAIQKRNMELNFRAFKYALFNISINTTDVVPKYEYIFEPIEGSGVTNYAYSDVTFHLKYAFQEKLISTYDKRRSLGTKYPVLYLTYTKGIKDLFDRDLEFNKAEARIEQSFFTKNIGLTKFRLNTGIIDKPLPYGLLFTGEGSYDKNFSFVLDNYFQTATPYEFLSDKYAHLFFSHNFGSLLFQRKKFKPEIIAHQNIGFGTLSHPEYHQLIEFKPMKKGFYESGIQSNNIVRVNYSNIAYIGLGGGVF
ncbi:MAG: carboxypeptidase-like regulatory domain-containing protein, partial [Fimbriimonadaceae bacterium]|nr:carboxypeptidase-like regulatory domain-containing protein [Chitinophagales bacterium]